jgi:hypothetical protein
VINGIENGKQIKTNQNTISITPDNTLPQGLLFSSNNKSGQKHKKNNHSSKNQKMSKTTRNTIFYKKATVSFYFFLFVAIVAMAQSDFGRMIQMTLHQPL